MRSLRLGLSILIATILCGSSLRAQKFVLPNIDFVAFEQEALEAVRRLPRKGGFKKNENYNHLYFFAAQMRKGVDWDKIETQADFIHAIDIQTPVLFEDREEPTNIYADYIYNSNGEMQWIYADGKAVRVDLKQTGNSPQNILIEIARQQYQMVFVIKEFDPTTQFFGIRDGKVYLTRHLIWESYDTYPISDLLANNSLRRNITSETPESQNGNGEEDEIIHPKFMDGDISAFRSWFQSETKSKIPQKELENADILLKFTVGTDGFVERVEIEKANNIDLAQQMVTIVKSSPQWTPGTRNGEPAKFIYMLPIAVKVTHQSTFESNSSHHKNRVDTWSSPTRTPPRQKR